jgi:hypothetical protein
MKVPMRLWSCLVALSAIFIATAEARAQVASEVFADPEGKYSLTLARGWSAVVSRDPLGRSDVKVVYNINEHGTLKIRRVTVEEGTEPLVYAKSDEEKTLRFHPGYDKGGIEPFRGGVDGALVSFDFMTGGKPMLGRVYYLRVNPTTIYVLRYTGLRNILGPIRNQTDQMARSFKGE